MSHYRIYPFVFFLFLTLNTVYLYANEPLCLREVALYSSRTGKLITSLSYSIEVNTSEGSENYILTIENKAGANGEKLSFWIFNKKMNAQEFAHRNSPMEVDDILYFNPFCRNSEAKFVIPSARKIEKQAVIPFDVYADLGSKVELLCVFYIATHKKKKTIINDEAQCKIEFVLPKKIVRDEMGRIVTLEVDKNLDLAVPLTPEELEKKRQLQEDSIQQVKIQQLHVFISEVNKEMASLNITVNSLLKDNVYEKHQVDSIENLVNTLKKKVDLQEMGNVNLFPYDESLMNHFTKFSSEYSDTIKKIEELKIPPEKRNWLMIIAIAAVVMFAGMFILQIWNQIKAKSQQLKMKREMKKEVKRSRLDNLNDDELDKI